MLKSAIRRILRQNEHLCLANITAVEDSLYGRIRRNLSHGCRCDCGTRRVQEGCSGGCCLCWSSTFLQSVGQNIRAVLQLPGRRIIACQALLIGMARNALDVLGGTHESNHSVIAVARTQWLVYFFDRPGPNEICFIIVESWLTPCGLFSNHT